MTFSSFIAKKRAPKIVAVLMESPDDVSVTELSHWPALDAWYWLNNRLLLPEEPDRRHRLVQVTAKTNIVTALIHTFYTVAYTLCNTAYVD